MTQADRDLAARVNSAAIHLLRRLAREDAASGVGPTQLSALSVLVFAGPRPITALADAERVRPATMSRVVRALERGGLAVRVPDAVDGRVSWIHATDEGRTVLQRARSARLDLLQAAIAELGPAERAHLAAATTLLEHLARR